MTPDPERLLSVAPSPAFWVAVVAYTAAAAALLFVLAGHAKLRPTAIALVVLAFVAHGADIGWRGTEHVHPAQSVREALGLLAFIITGGYLLASTRFRLTLGGAAVMPVSLILLLVEERALKRKKFDTLAFKDKGAPLESLDRLSHRLIWIGFPIFTVALVLGAIWVSKLGESLDRPEYPLAAVTWIFYAVLLVARQAYGWRGRRAARLTLAGFAMALLVLVIYLFRRMAG